MFHSLLNNIESHNSDLLAKPCNLWWQEAESHHGDQQLFVQDKEGGNFGPPLEDGDGPYYGPASFGMGNENEHEGYSIEYIQRPGHWHWAAGDMIEVITIKDETVV